MLLRLKYYNTDFDVNTVHNTHPLSSFEGIFPYYKFVFHSLFGHDFSTKQKACGA